MTDNNKLNALLAASRAAAEKHAAKAVEPAAKKPFNLTAPAAPDAPKRDILWGTGLTQKAAKSAQSNFLKTAQQITALEPVAEAEAIQSKAEAETTHADGTVDIKTDQPEPEQFKRVVLDEFQAAAVRNLSREKYGCLVGSAGTGKTTTERELVEEFEKQTPVIDVNLARRVADRTANPDLKPAIAFMAFTGRAVQQMKRALPKKYHPMCSTIHAGLGYAPEFEPREQPNGEWKDVMVFRPTFTANNKLPYKVVFMDESGMTPIPLWDELIAALPDDCRIILIGDINQLPPVQGRSVLGFAMLKWPTFTLEKIHRQAEDNPIIANAHRILRGELPRPDSKHFVMINVSDGSIGTYNKAQQVVMHLHRNGKFDPLVDGMIVPQNIGTLGQEHFNEKLVHYFNPPQRNEDGAIINHRQIIIGAQKACAFAVGDKVMLLKNDRPRNLTNGMTGVVSSIMLNGNYRGKDLAALHRNDNFHGNLDLTNLEDDVRAEMAEAEEENKQQASHIVHVKFGELEVPFSTRGDFANIAHAYTFTCHKSQGGEYPTVIIVCHSANIKMLTREWLYTAVTRAQEKVVLIYNDRGLLQAINTQRIKGNSVAEKAQSFLALQDKRDTRIPMLPEPRKV